MGVLRIEEAERFRHGERQDVGDREPLVLDREDLGTKALALAYGAENRHVRQKLHLDRLVALSGAGFAATRRRSAILRVCLRFTDVEGEMGWREPSFLGFGLGGEPRSDAAPGLRIRRGIAASRATERGLVDQDDS